jgi:hypothetical protein
LACSTRPMALIDSTGKHAGHQVQDQSAQDREQQQHGQRGAGLRGRGARPRRRRRRADLSTRAPAPPEGGGDLDGHRHGVVAALLGGQQHAATMPRPWAADSRASSTVRRRPWTSRQGLRRGVLDAALVVGKECQRLDLRQGLAPLLAERDHQAGRPRCARWSRPARLGSSLRAAVKQRGVLRIDGARAALTGSVSCRSALSGMHTSEQTSQLAFAGAA